MNNVERRSHRQDIAVAIIIGVVSLVVGTAVAVWAELRPDESPGGNPATPNASPTATGRPNSPAPSVTPGATAFDFLSALEPASRTFLTELPDGLPGPSSYDRAITVRCPGAGVTADVTYNLFGGYRALTATVRPVFQVRTDQAVVTASAATKNPDDTVTKRVVGQVVVAAGGALPLTGDLRKADQLVIQIRCPSAEGVVVVDDGRLTRTP